MAAEQAFVTLKDEEGNYYVLSRELVETGRVPDEDKEELEEILAGDTHGYIQGWQALFMVGAFRIPESFSFRASGLELGLLRQRALRQ